MKKESLLPNMKILSGDLVFNKESQTTFLITKVTRSNLELLQTTNGQQQTFTMSRSRFVEQVTSERGIESLIYFSVKRSINNAKQKNM